MDAASFRVSWSRFPAHVLAALDELRHDEDFVDVDIYCAGRRIKAHRNVLSASSTYFKDIFKANPSSHPVVILCDVDYASLRSLVDFMYHGEIEVPTARLDELLRLGEMLQVHGISMPKSPPSGSGSVPAGDSSLSDCGLSEPADGPLVHKRRHRSRRSRSPAVQTLPEPAQTSCVTPQMTDGQLGRGVAAAGVSAVMDGLPGMGAAAAGVSAVMDGLLPLLSACAAELPTPPARASAQPPQSCLSPPPEAPVSPLPQPEDLTARPPVRSPSPSAGPAPAVVGAGMVVEQETPPPPEQPPPPLPAIKLEPPADADTKLLMDEMMEHQGLDSSQYLGVFSSTLGGLGRPMTGAERARRYRERKKLKKLYESLLGSSPGREQLAVQL